MVVPNRNHMADQGAGEEVAQVNDYADVGIVIAAWNSSRDR